MEGAKMSDTDTATFEEVASSVADLTQAVEDMRAGTVDRTTVEQICENAIAQARGLGDGVPEPDAQRQAEIERLNAIGDVETRAQLALAERAVDVAPILGVEQAKVEKFQTASDRLLILGACMRAANPDKAVHLSELIDRVNLALRVAAFFGPPIPMPTNPYRLPARPLARVRGGRHPEQTADTGQTAIKKVTPGSRQIELEAAKFAAMTLVSKEAEEDQIIPVLPFIEAELRDGQAADIDDAAVNGDTTRLGLGRGR
jgi:hypothetical protein